MRDIATKWLDWKTLGPIVERYHALIAPEAVLDTRKLESTKNFNSSVTALKTFAEKWRAYLLEKTRQ